VKRWARAALCGTGHIGGSLLLALRRAGVVDSVAGYDRDRAAAERAKERGIADEVADSAVAAVAGAQLIVCAVPVGAMADLFREIAGAIDPGALITDVGSTKQTIVSSGETILGPRFVGAHPVAGSERSGPDAADPGLLAGRVCLLCPTEKSDPAAVAECAAVWQSAGMRTRAMDPARHDRLLARSSHLPHVAAFALAAALDGVTSDEESDAIADLAGASLRDTTRVAASSAATWSDLLLENRGELLPIVEQLAAEVESLRAAISDGDRAKVAAIVARAGSGRQRLVRS
jgi:prephenate dehydrogenase